MRDDLRLALRTLAREPGFAAAAVLTLALGLGANTAIFTVVHAVLLDPLPYPDADRLVMVGEKEEGRAETNEAAAETFLDWREQARSFAHLSAWRYWDYAMTGGDEPEAVMAARVSANLFDLLGVRPMRGRPFSLDEERPGRDRAVILSHALWMRRFGGDEGIVGRSVLLDGEAYAVVGVMPAGFVFPDEQAAMWTPLAFKDHEQGGRARRAFPVLGRLAPGATLAQARAEMEAISRRLAAEFPQTNAGWTATLTPASEAVAGSSKTSLLVLWGAVGLVLLIACANAAHLLLARAVARQREMAVRIALGAARHRLVRHLLAESLVLTAAGAVVGFLLAAWSLDFLGALVPEFVPRSGPLRPNLAVLWFTAVLAAATALAAAALPAWQASGADPASALKQDGGPVSGAKRPARWRDVLVVSEVAFAVVLTVGAGLLVRTLWRLHRVDPGFDPDRLLALTLYLPDNRYPERQQQTAFFEGLLERVRAVPGVTSAGAVTALPMSDVGIDHDVAVLPEGRTYAPGQEPRADLRIASPGYFRAMRIPIVGGRGFGEHDRAGAPEVAVVNRAFAAELMGGEDPVGTRVRWGRGGRSVEIVGLVEQVRHRGLGARPRPEIYLPFGQLQYGGMTLAVRTEGEPLALAAAVKEQVYALDPRQPVTVLTTMEALVAGSIQGPRFQSGLLGGFAVLALALAAVGIYGVLAHGVRRRTRELGIHAALGAGGSDLFRLVLRRGMGLSLLGTIIGLSASLALGRLLSGLLFEVAPHDPLALAAAAVLLPAVALAACAVPARRAGRTHPMQALRYE